MISLTESDLSINDDVIVINQNKPHYDEIGKIYKINRHTTPPTVSVIFDGNVFRYKLEDLAIA